MQVSTASVALIPDLGHHCTVSVSALGFAMCSVMGMFAALASQLPCREQVNRKYFLLCLHPEACPVAQGQCLLSDFSPVRWDCQLGLQVEVEGAVPRAGQGC